MATWEMACSCGDTFQVEGDSKEHAVDAMMAQMTPDAMAQHMAEKHPGEPTPTPEQARQGMMATAHTV